MKKLLLLIGITLSLMASEIKWSNLNDGMKIAEKKDKLMLIMMTSSQCGYCAKMEKNTLSNVKVIDSLNNFFIPIKIDITTDDYPSTLNVRGTPTFFFATKDKVIVEKAVGYRDTEDFLSVLTKVMMRKE